MGQSFNKNSNGGEDTKKKEKKVKECYDKHFKDVKDKCDFSYFYRAVCDTVESLNEEMSYTQVKAIDKKTLKDEYENCDKDTNGKPKEAAFRKIMEDMEKKFEVTGLGVKDMLLYVFGVPASATLIKNAVMPTVVPNEVLIPGMTSLTVLVLARLNRI